LNEKGEICVMASVQNWGDACCRAKCIFLI
jgi:hypothetical protein